LDTIIAYEKSSKEFWSLIASKGLTDTFLGVLFSLDRDIWSYANDSLFAIIPEPAFQILVGTWWENIIDWKLAAQKSKS
jgi:hypothetical protein